MRKANRLFSDLNQQGRKNEYLKAQAKENKKGQGISVINNDKSLNVQSLMRKSVLSISTKVILIRASK
jgi:hypothetical protein